MNYSGFKKTHDDNERAILKNKHGHSITIAKKALSKEHLSALKKLPLYASDANDGDALPDDSTPAMQPNETGALGAGIGAEAGTNPPPPEENDDTSNVVTPERTPVQAAQANTTGANISDPTLAPDIAKHYTEENQKWAQDLANGHITPKTYGDLFANRGTLGKLGTIFGLLIGGAGSGITGQPNAALQMMDKELERDLEAQKQSKSNAYNFLRMSQAHELQKAQIPKLMAETELNQAQVHNIASQIDARSLDMSIMRMRYAALQHFINLTKPIPEGTQPKMAAGQVLTGVANGVNEANTNTTLNAVQRHQAQAAQEQTQYENTTQAMRGAGMMGLPEATAQADYREQHEIPGVGWTTKTVTPQVQDRVLKINRFQNLLNEAEHLNNQMSLFGRLTPANQARALQLKNDMISGYNDVKGLNRFTSNEEKLYNGIIGDVGNVKNQLTGSTRASFDQLKSSVAKIKTLEYTLAGVHPFGGDMSAPQHDAPAPKFRKGQTGRDKVTKKPVVFDGENWVHQ